ncbi:hypothetical protein COOONC_00730 [Cooperia oncophora]
MRNVMRWALPLSPKAAVFGAESSETRTLTWRTNRRTARELAERLECRHIPLNSHLHGRRHEAMAHGYRMFLTVTSCRKQCSKFGGTLNESLIGNCYLQTLLQVKTSIAGNTASKQAEIFSLQTIRVVCCEGNPAKTPVSRKACAGPPFVFGGPDPNKLPSAPLVVQPTVKQSEDALQVRGCLGESVHQNRMISI